MITAALVAAGFAVDDHDHDQICGRCDRDRDSRHDADPSARRLAGGRGDRHGSIPDTDTETCLYRDRELIVRFDTEAQRTDFLDNSGGSFESLGPLGGDVPLFQEGNLAAGFGIIQIAGDDDPFVIAQELAGTVAASPNYLAVFVPRWKYAPADSPAEWFGGQVGGALSEVAEARIAVLDTAMRLSLGRCPRP